MSGYPPEKHCLPKELSLMFPAFRGSLQPPLEGLLPNDDIQLMLKTASGPEAAAAFALLVDRYTGRIRSYFRRHLGDFSQADDLTQEVFLRVYRARQRYRPQASFATWIFHIARNVLRNHHRSHFRHPSVPLCNHGHARNPLRGEPDTPNSSLERAERDALIRKALGSLNERKRAALQLHQMEDRSCAEVGELLRMTPKAAKSLLHRARHELKSHLEKLQIR